MQVFDTAAIWMATHQRNQPSMLHRLNLPFNASQSAKSAFEQTACLMPLQKAAAAADSAAIRGLSDKDPPDIAPNSGQLWLGQESR